MSTQPRHIAILGAGITGAFSAYFLALQGARVTLIERASIAAGASGHNAGGLNPLLGAGIPGPMLELALTSLQQHTQHWSEIRRLSGIDFDGHRVSRLILAFESGEIAKLESVQALSAVTDGFWAELLSGTEVRRREPQVAPAALAGLWSEGNARVEPAAYTRAVAAAARRLGASLVFAEARELRQVDGRVTAVALDSGVEIACDGAVLATGPWADEPERWLDLSLDITPIKGELLLLEPHGDPAPDTEITWGPFGIYPGPRGCVWVGGTEDQTGFDVSTDPSARARILAGLAAFLPGFRRHRVVKQVAGLRPVSRDGLPIVGMAPGWENVCLTMGSGRKGMLYSAAIGLAAAQLLTEGRTLMPIAACRPDRLAAAAAAL